MSYWDTLTSLLVILLVSVILIVPILWTDYCISRVYSLLQIPSWKAWIPFVSDYAMYRILYTKHQAMLLVCLQLLAYSTPLVLPTLVYIPLNWISLWKLSLRYSDSRLTAFLVTFCPLPVGWIRLEKCIVNTCN